VYGELVPVRYAARPDPCELLKGDIELDPAPLQQLFSCYYFFREIYSNALD